MKSFQIKTRVNFGDNALDRLAEVPYKKILIVTDPFMAKSKNLNLILDPIKKAGKEYDIFQDIVPDPPIEKISLGVKKMLEYKPDAIVAVGGGSAIDSSKSIREFALRVDHYAEVGLIAIPTTSGTGSEVTSFAVVSDPAEQRKYPLVSWELTPDEAILDAELVKSVPPAITADTGMDVFTHALEACVSTDRSDFSTALAEKSIELVGVFLLRAYLDGNDTHARQKMHSASCLAGLAFNSASLGLNHGMAHQLGAKFHIPHGRANAMLLPHIIEFNSDINKHSKSQKEYLPAVKRYATVAQILGLSSYNEIMTVRSLVNWVQFMLKEMDIPLSISQMGTISEEEYFNAIDSMAVYTISNTWEMDRKREMKLPIYIEAAMGVFLVVILAMAGRNGMIPQNPKNNVMKQSEVEQKSDYDMQNEKEAVVEEATDSIEEVAQTDSAAITAQMCSPAGQYPVMGESVVTVDELADYFNQSGYEYPSEELAKGGADTIETFCQIYCEEAEAEDIRVEVAFTQAMKETGFLQFGGDVSVEQFNFAGIGTTGGGVPGNSYPDVRTGVRAQIQHLKAYATDEPLNQTCVDNRYEYVKKASAPYVQWLGQKENPEGAGWATGENYGYDIAGMLQHLLLKEQG